MATRNITQVEREAIVRRAIAERDRLRAAPPSQLVLENALHRIEALATERVRADGLTLNAIAAIAHQARKEVEK